MFTNLRITNNILRFNWRRESGEYFVIRNKLTKKEYYSRLCNDMIRENGIDLITNRIPKDVPLEVVSRKEGRRDISCNVANITPYKIYYKFNNNKDGTCTMDIHLPGITEEMGEYLPENMIFFEIVTPDDMRIPLYLPKLRPGYNCFWFTDPGGNCRVLVNYPKLNDNISVCDDTIKGVFQLKCGEPPQYERRY